MSDEQTPNPEAISEENITVITEEVVAEAAPEVAPKRTRKAAPQVAPEEVIPEDIGALTEFAPGIFFHIKG